MKIDDSEVWITISRNELTEWIEQKLDIKVDHIASVDAGRWSESEESKDVMG